MWERLDNGDGLQRENKPPPGTLITLVEKDDLLLLLGIKLVLGGLPSEHSLFAGELRSVDLLLLARIKVT